MGLTIIIFLCIDPREERKREPDLSVCVLTSAAVPSVNAGGHMTGVIISQLNTTGLATAALASCLE